MARSGLARLALLVVITAVTAVALVLTTALGPGEPTRVFGMPLCGINPSEPCLLVLGIGVGGVVVGVGAGLVALTWGGAGLLFATGQIALGAITFGQVGVALTFFAGQAGVGLTGIAQGVLGMETVSPGNASGKEFLTRLNRELGQILSLRRAR